jgi:hypothetical protein
MMNQQTDKFFRDKLEQHQRPAPPAAWDRIEAGMAKKNKPVIYWMKIAASLLIVAVAAFVLWPSGEKDNGKTARKTENPVPIDTAKEKTETPSREELPSEKAVPLVAEKQSNPSGKSKPLTKVQPLTVPSHPEENSNRHSPDPKKEQEKIPVAIPMDEDVTDADVIEPDAVAEVTQTNTASNQNIKIVISAADSEKFLNKKYIAEATPEEKKTSTLKKLLDKADDLTTNQDPFGEIRQMKNEILALNFKSEKQRGQNK